MRRGAQPINNDQPRYRGTVNVRFPAIHSMPTLADASGSGRPHGHDFCAEFLFETDTLVYPGVVVDDVLRAQITDHVDKRLAYRDLDRMLDRPATCEAVAETLALWFTRSARPAEHAELVAVMVTTGAGGYGQINLPPAGLRAPRGLRP